MKENGQPEDETTREVEIKRSKEADDSNIKENRELKGYKNTIRYN